MEDPNSMAAKIRSLSRSGHTRPEIAQIAGTTLNYVDNCLALARNRKGAWAKLDLLSHRLDDISARLDKIERALFEGRTDGVQGRLAELRAEMAKERRQSGSM